VLAAEYGGWLKGRSEESAGEEKLALVGSLVLDRFLIERRIGGGGFGVVYEAWDGRLERAVAVKAIEQRGEAGKRVMREAQAAARLNHPGIVTLYEMGEEDGNALLVSELVEGDTLARLAAADALSDREIGEIGADLCEALDHAHSRGVIHRDIKPQNVQVVEGQPRAKLMDFGIALIADAGGLTATGDVVGTLAYMSPEQAEGREAGPEADVYSLALTLYECWSGENPHRRGNAVATVRSIGRRARPLHRLRPDLPRELTAEIDACLDPDPRNRPSLEELGGAIEDSLDELSDHSEGAARHIGLRLGALGVAAAIGAILVLGHGLVLP
jgi:serine/threonine protein kinase